ncbi:MAG TPA: sigma-E factor negative regulatory protein [Burkholderiales bacterium]|nr:sigma-E factor negative regulatory protein [Burkholderiales bacterium]
MKDRISVLMDGELDDRSAAQAIDALATEGEARDAWRTYHLISDALGKSRILSAGFSERVAAALAAEPTVLAPRRLGVPREPRRWLALAAGVAAVSLVGWLGFGPQPTAVAPVAQAPKSTIAPGAAKEGNAAVVPLPSGANDYLLAHQAFSPRMSFQGMAPYALTVSGRAQEPRR